MNGPKRLTLHIGAPRTGNSAIHTWLAANRRSLLASAGVSYPRAPDRPRGRRGAAPPGNGDGLARELCAPEPEATHRALALADDIVSSRHANLLLSSDALWLTPPERFAALARHLDGRAQVRIVAYVRPQVDQVRSAYLANLALAGGAGGLCSFFDERRTCFLAAERLAALQETFGAANVVLRKFGPGRFVTGELIGDFLDACAIVAPPGDSRPAAAGPSLDAEHYLFARMAGSRPDLGAGRMKQLRQGGILASLYARAEPVRGVQMMDAQTARHVADSCREDNLLLDRLAPAADLHLDDDNRRAVEAIAAASDAPLQGVSRARLLLLARVAELETRMAALKASLSETQPASPEA